MPSHGFKSTFWDLVEKLGCDAVQGYFVAKRMSGPDIPGWIDDWSR